MTTATTSTYILDPFQQLIPHTTSSFKTKIKGLGGIRSLHTLTSSTNYSTSTIIQGAIRPLDFNLKIMPGSWIYNTWQDYADPSLPGRSTFFWNVHSGIETTASAYYVVPEPITPVIQPSQWIPSVDYEGDKWEEMLGSLGDIIYDPNYIGDDKYRYVYYYYANLYFDGQIISSAGKINVPIGNSVVADNLFPQSWLLNVAGRYQGYPLIYEGSSHIIKAEIWQDDFPGRDDIYGIVRNPDTGILEWKIIYPALPSREKKFLASVSQTITYTGSRALISTHNTGTVSSNTGSSTATSVELLYYVNNKKMSESIDIFASFSTGTSWANLWDLPNKFRSKSTSTGNLSIIAELKFNNQSIQMIKDKWPISSVGSKLIGKLYNTTDMKTSNIPWNEKEGRLYVLNTVTTTDTSQMSVVEFQRNSTNTVSINITFTDDTGTVYTTASSVIARWV